MKFKYYFGTVACACLDTSRLAALADAPAHAPAKGSERVNGCGRAAGRCGFGADPLAKTSHIRRTPMRLVRDGGTVTLYRGGIPLLSLGAPHVAPTEPAPLRIAWRDCHAMIHYFYGLCIATAE